MYHIFLIHSSVDGHIGCLRVLAVVYCAAKNTEYMYFFQHIFKLHSNTLLVIMIAYTLQYNDGFNVVKIFRSKFFWQLQRIVVFLMYSFLFVCLFCFVLLFRAAPAVYRRSQVPRLGVKLELQMLAYTTAPATRDLSCVCDLGHGSWQCHILNPLSEARQHPHGS